MRTLIPVETDASLARDPNSNAILSVDRNKLQKYKQRKSVLESKEEKINMLNDRISKLEEMINELINKNA